VAPVEDRVEVRVEADDARCADVLWSGTRSLGLLPPPGGTSDTAPPAEPSFRASVFAARSASPRTARANNRTPMTRPAEQPAPSADGGSDRPSAPRYFDVAGPAEYLGVTVGFVRRLVLERRSPQ